MGQDDHCSGGKYSGGIVDFTLTLVIDGGTSSNIDLFSQDFKIEVPLTDCVNNVKVKPIRAGGQNFEYKESDDFMGIDQRMSEMQRINILLSWRQLRQSTENPQRISSLTCADE